MMFSVYFSNPATSRGKKSIYIHLLLYIKWVHTQLGSLEWANGIQGIRAIWVSFGLGLELGSRLPVYGTPFLFNQSYRKKQNGTQVPKTAAPQEKKGSMFVVYFFRAPFFVLCMRLFFVEFILIWAPNRTGPESKIEKEI